MGITLKTDGIEQPSPVRAFSDRAQIVAVNEVGRGVQYRKG